MQGRYLGFAAFLLQYSPFFNIWKYSIIIEYIKIELSSKTFAEVQSRDLQAPEHTHKVKSCELDSLWGPAATVGVILSDDFKNIFN